MGLISLNKFGVQGSITRGETYIRDENPNHGSRKKIIRLDNKNKKWGFKDHNNRYLLVT